MSEELILFPNTYNRTLNRLETIMDNFKLKNDKKLYLSQLLKKTKDAVDNYEDRCVCGLCAATSAWAAGFFFWPSYIVAGGALTFTAISKYKAGMNKSKMQAIKHCLNEVISNE